MAIRVCYRVGWVFVCEICVNHGRGGRLHWQVVVINVRWYRQTRGKNRKDRDADCRRARPDDPFSLH